MYLKLSAVSIRQSAFNVLAESRELKAAFYSLSLKASPNRLNPKTVISMARPGQTDIHQAAPKTVLDSARIFPQLA